jgi:histidinol-phosphate aminotransferase
VSEPDLSHHGDQEAAPGLLDLAVNVRREQPAWLREALVASVRDLAAYPDPCAATEAVAARHGRHPDEVLLTVGAAEAFVLLARTLTPRHAVCVHPSFTEPESALRAAGHTVHRHVLPPPYVLAGVPEPADLVVVGNPTNPTGVLHDDLAQLCWSGRTVVVDEAFMDAVPGEPGSLAGRADLPGLVVVRSLTKTWGLAGLRVGYVLAAAATVRALRAVQPLWAVSTPALEAARLCSAPAAVTEAQAWAQEMERERERLAAELRRRGVDVTPSRGPFLLCRSAPGTRAALRERGIAVRRGETFPGLTSEHWRTAVRDRAKGDALLAALDELA